MTATVNRMARLRGELHRTAAGAEGTVTQLLNDVQAGVIAVSLAPSLRPARRTGSAAPAG